MEKANANELPAKKDKLCFVLMPFGGWSDTYWEDIYHVAIKETQYEPLRADDIYKPSDVMASIWENVNKADILLADLTNRNPNVFYELGLAHAQQKPVILVISSNDEIPFDLRALRHIIYDKNDPDWGNKLIKNIQHTLASPNVETSIPQVFKMRFNEDKERMNSIRLDKRELTADIQHALSNRTSIGHLRIFAHSTSMIYNAMMEPLKNRVNVDKCEIILRKLPSEDIYKEEQNRINGNIKKWKSTKSKHSINTLEVYQFPNELTEYYVIIDNEVLISGMYIRDDTEESKITAEQMLYVDNRHGMHNDITEMYIQKFDKLKSKLEQYKL